MHFVPESAITARELKKRTVRSDLTRVARRMTAEHGLHGFTVEDLCEEVGVSRRTFFNYFGGKEEAVFGLDMSLLDGALAEKFIADGDPVSPEVTPNLLPDLVSLAAAHGRRMHASPEETAHLVAAIRREPKLFERFSSLGEQRHRLLVELVERREGLVPGDLRADAAVRLLDALVHGSGARYISPGNTVPFEDLLAQSLDAALCILPFSPRDFEKN
jgi:AcrR family transcriptional regulator